MSWRGRLCGVITALGMAGLGVISAAAPAAAAGWVDQGPVSPAGSVAGNPELAVTSQGTRVVAWITRTTSPVPTETVSVRVAPAGGSFGAIQTFPGNGFVLRLATGADGTAALAWFGDANTIHVAHLAPGATTFAEATPVPIPASESPIDLRLAVTSGGEAVTAASAFGVDGTSIWVHSLAAGASSLQLVSGSATGGAVDHASFSAGGTGASVSGADIVTSGADVYVAWQQDASPTTPQGPEAITVRIAKRLIGGPAGRFNPPVPVETIQQLNFVSTETRLAAGGNHVYVAWTRPNTQGRGVIGYTDLTRADTVHVISTDPGPDLEFAGADGAGTLIVTGTADPLGTRARLVYAAAVPPSAGNVTATEITPPGPTREPQALAVAPNGTAVILPDRVPDEEGQIVQIQASRRASGGAFGPPEDVSGVREGGAAGVDAAAAIGPDGSEFAVWLATDPDGTLNDRIHFSERDATPPSFTGVAVPSTVSVGSRVALTASATDRLTGPAHIRWDFGDGSQATGNSVTHAFGSAGGRTITVTATDAVGNSVSQTHTIAVRATPVPAPAVSRVAFTPARFKAAQGSVLNFNLNVRATVIVNIARGRARAGEIVQLTVAPGHRRMRFSGRALTPGRYTASVTAVDAARRRSRPVNASFTILRAGR
jgi:hypothetical protein